MVKLFTVLIITVLLSVFSLNSYAQSNYPNKTIKFIVPFAASGPADVIARTLADPLSKELKQSILIENKPGADTLIGTRAAMQADPDGYTLLFGSSSNSVISFLHPEHKIDPTVDLIPTGLIGIAPNFIVVNPQLPINTVTELIAYAKNNPGMLNYANTTGHIYLQIELFKSMAHINLTEIPYKGVSQAMTALLSNEVQLTISSVTTLAPYVNANKLRALAITGAKRSVLFPNIPTVTEKSIPGYTGGAWYGVLAPIGTSPEVVKVLNNSINQVLRNPDIGSDLLNKGVEITISTPQEFSKFLSKDQDYYAKIVKEINGKK